MEILALNPPPEPARGALIFLPCWGFTCAPSNPPAGLRPPLKASH